MDIRLNVSCIFVGQKITDTIPINAKYVQLTGYILLFRGIYPVNSNRYK